MTNEPTDPHPTHDEIAPDPGDEAYPDILRITALPAGEAHAESRDRLERWEAGEDVESARTRVVNFEDRSQLRRLLTPRREELLEAVMADPPKSIRALADRLDRDVRDVHDDLSLLADYRIVHFREAGRAKQPFVPYETVRIEVEFGPRHSSSSSSSTSDNRADA